MTLRSRFAPSPTGLLHIGNLRSALLNWAFINNKVTPKTFSISILLLLVLDIMIVDNKIIQPKKNSGRSSQLLNNSIVDRYFQHDQISKILTIYKNMFKNLDNFLPHLQVL